MDGLSSNSFLMMQRSMEFLWSKQSCILDNIANVETPGYQVKYATFEEALKNAVLSSAQNGISSSSIRKAIEETPVVVREAQESVRMDGNGVNITEQSGGRVRVADTQRVSNAVCIWRHFQRHCYASGRHPRLMRQGGT